MLEALNRYLINIKKTGKDSTASLTTSCLDNSFNPLSITLGLYCYKAKSTSKPLYVPV